ncbi:MAG: NFACT family protein, partial [Chloroflexota bacterium]|nr:NFACT family protein [Chloroflexota bacterium]
MESAKRVTLAMSRVRPVLPRLPYIAPPPQVEKNNPRQVTTDDVARLLSEDPEAKLADLLVRRLRGLSPQIGRELAFLMGGRSDVVVHDLDRDAAQLLARETRGMFEPLLTSAWSPRVYLQADEVVAFAAIPLRHLAALHTEEPRTSMSEAAELGSQRDGAETPRDHAQRRARLAASIRDARRRLEVRRRSLDVEVAKVGEIERLRQRGDLIYAYLWRIEPGASELEADDVRVPLDPSLSAKENAQVYFERYRKAQGAGEHVPALIAQTDAELAYLDQLLILTEQAEGFAAIESLTAEWQARGGESRKQSDRGARATTQSKRPRPVHEADGYAVYVGRSGRENDQVTFDLAGQDDTWLHARGVPGSHVVVRWRQTDEAEQPAAIEIAAGLAAYYSSARSSTTVDVDVTRRR